MSTVRPDETPPGDAAACDSALPPMLRPDHPLFAHDAPHPQSSPCGRFMVVEETPAELSDPLDGGDQ